MRIIVIILSFILFSSEVFADWLALPGKKINFYLEDSTGNFYAENPSPVSQNAKYFLFKDNPPTSFILLSINGKPFRIKEMKPVVPFRIADSSIVGVYQANGVDIKVAFIMTNLSGIDNDSVICYLAVMNNTALVEVNIWARFLFDTVFDEMNKKVKIFLPSGEKIEYDRLIRQDILPNFLFCGEFNPDNPSQGVGLYIYPSINMRYPENIVVGNWKRLSEKEFNEALEVKSGFRYGPFGNPDASIAVNYKNLTVKRNSTLSIGTVMSTARFSQLRLNLTEPDEGSKATEIIPAGNIKTAPAFSVPVETGTSSDAMKAQLAILERANSLLDKIESFMNPTNPSAVNFNGGNETALSRGLERGLSDYGKDDPFENRNLTGAVVPRVSVGVTTPDNRAPLLYTNIVYTNMKMEMEVEDLKIERDRMQREYEEKMDMLQKYYEKELKKQEAEFRNVSPDYKQKMDNWDKKKANQKQVKEMDSTIHSLDKKLAVIGELMDLNVDFNTLPPEKLSEISSQMDELEKKMKE